MLCVSLLDLNGLKDINDRYGHNVGDCALVTAAKALRGNIRTSDVVARVGGDEFSLLFPQTVPECAKDIVERIGVTRMAVPGVDAPTVTFSWGAASWPDDGETADVLLQAADRRLYKMKHASRPASRPDLGAEQGENRIV